MFSTPVGAQFMLNKDNMEITVEAVVQGLLTDDAKKRLVSCNE